MIDSSTLYFIFSILFLSLSLLLKNYKSSSEESFITDTNEQEERKTKKG